MSPYKGRAFVTSIATCFNWSMVFLVTKTFPLIVDAAGIHTGFFFFGLWALVAIAFTHFLLPETKGKTFEDLEHIFD